MYRYLYILHLQSYLENVYDRLNAFNGTYNSSYRCDKGLPWIPEEDMLPRTVIERTVSWIVVPFKPFNAEVTFVQGTRTQRCLKTI